MCPCSANLSQEIMRVYNFPYDENGTTTQLSIVADIYFTRHCDCWMWKLALATEVDSQGSTMIPHGLLINNASTPHFVRSSE